MVNDDFHPFSRLPLELRQEIWRLCLPHRVTEMDYTRADIVFDVFDPDNLAELGYGVGELLRWHKDNTPCELHPTSKSNVRPPLLTRVCRESRRVALATGKWVPMLQWRPNAPSLDNPWEADWRTGNVIDHGYWEDASHDSAHMNWTPAYDVDFGPVDPRGHPLTSLAKEAKRLNGTASFMLDAMTDSWERDPYTTSTFSYTALPEDPQMSQREQNLAASKQLPEWMVVVEMVIIHLDIGRAADSGLFRLSGDEIIQVVDATLPLAERLYALAEHCERGAAAVTAAQDFTRMSADDMDAMVKRAASEVTDDPDVLKRLRPAIMFRLCTEMCNHIAS